MLNKRYQLSPLCINVSTCSPLYEYFNVENLCTCSLSLEVSNRQISWRVVFKACRVSYSIHLFEDFSVMLCTLQARVSTSEDNHLKLKKERQDAIMAQFRAKYV